MSADALAGLSPATRTWFAAAFPAPTDAQVGAWRAALRGGHVLVSAPTGSGKTLAAFLVAIDRLLHAPAGPRGPARTRVLYVSPLKALAYDVDRNLRAPLTGIRQTAERLGTPLPPVEVGMRTGDTPADERRRLVRHPPDVLITTPESLYLYLTSSARSTLAGVEVVIVDEVHAVAGGKRGTHLALSLERLEHLRTSSHPDAPALQRIGLSATQRPLDEVARFLGGGVVDDDGTWSPRPVEVVDVRSDKVLDVEVVVPVEDMVALGQPVEPAASGPSVGPVEARRSIWSAVHPRVLDLVLAHRSTIVFCNSRRLAERLCANLNDLHDERVLAEAEAAGSAPPDAIPALARAHHGSIAREHRLTIEEDLKAGRLRCVVATSSLELGIDMGAVDLVVQVESPGSVASGLQRIGRAGHQVGAPSVGKVFPKYRGDLLEAAVVVRRMLEGEIEETRYPRVPLDVLAQQVVAMAAMGPWPLEELHRVVRGAAPYADLSRAQLDGVLDMLTGRYPSDEFAELRPRLQWDRVGDVITARRGAQRIATTSGGTIPDRGLYGVFIAGDGDGRRVGELDEELVYETRPGETIVLGASTWRIVDITRDQVQVVPAPGEPGKLPFWHGDAPSRPIEVGRAVGAFLREVESLDGPAAARHLRDAYGLDALAAANLVEYLGEQREVVGSLPTDRHVVVERFRDEIGDWRVCLHSPFGGRVHAPWALAIEARARDRLGLEVQTMVADDGIVLRLLDVDVGGDAVDGAGLLELLLPDAEEVADLVVAELAESALFAARFRECAARALLLPRRRPGGRTPLWQQRQRSADLLQVASRYGSFPVLLETYRECLRDVFDVPALEELLRAIGSRRVRVTAVETATASPFASSLLFDYVAGFMYAGDAPLAERRASALALDRDLLAELLGSDELRDLLDPDALQELELELQRLVDGRRARDVDEVADLLRTVGDLTTAEVVARVEGVDVPGGALDTVETWLHELDRGRRAFLARVGGDERWVAAEDAARVRDGLGVPLPQGLPQSFLEPLDDPLGDLVARYARTHGPFTSVDVAHRLGLGTAPVERALADLERRRRVASGAFRPTSAGGSGSAREWIDLEVLRRLRRRSLAALRSEVEPVDGVAYARFLPAWQGVTPTPRAGGVARLLEVVEQLQGAAIPASALEADVLPARLRSYQPAWLDELCASGEVVWVGRGPLGASDGRLSLYLRDQAPLLAPAPQPDVAASLEAALGEEAAELHCALLEALVRGGAAFWPRLHAGAGGGDEGTALAALWDLVWSGLVSNDAFSPVRALVAGGGARRPGGRARRRPGRVLPRTGPPTAAGRWTAWSEVLADAVALGGSASAAAEVEGRRGGRRAEAAHGSTRRAAALAAVLLHRHGVVTRDAVAAEEVPGGFSALYPVLVAMEESGRARRGHFVERLGGAQFAMPGAVDRLRSLRSAARDGEGSGALVLATTDPANPYGAALPWPDPTASAAGGSMTPRAAARPRRAAGTLVVLVDGDAVLHVGGRSVLALSTDDDRLDRAVRALAETVRSRHGVLRVGRIDGEEVGDQPLVRLLRHAGFVDDPRGLVLRATSGARAGADAAAAERYAVRR